MAWPAQMWDWLWQKLFIFRKSEEQLGFEYHKNWSDFVVRESPRAHIRWNRSNASRQLFRTASGTTERKKRIKTGQEPRKSETCCLQNFWPRFSCLYNYIYIYIYIYLTIYPVPGAQGIGTRSRGHAGTTRFIFVSFCQRLFWLFLLRKILPKWAKINQNTMNNWAKSIPSFRETPLKSICCNHFFVILHNYDVLQT